MTTTLIAGGCGFIGLNLAEACLRAGEDVLLADRNPPPAAAGASFDTLPGHWRHCAVDVTDPVAVARLFSQHRPRQVYYGAALTSGPDRERQHPERVLQVNLLGLTLFLKEAARQGAHRFINISSGSAYGDGGFAHGGGQAPLDEDASRPLPTSLYSVSKFASEGVCRRMAQLNDLDAFSVRLAIIFGPWELDTGSRDTLSPPMLAAIRARHGEEITLARRDARDWTYSRDVAQALRALMGADTHAHDLYNISAGRTCSLLDICDALAAHIPGLRHRLVHSGEAPSVTLHGDQDRLVMSPRRLREDIGHTVPGDLDAIAADFAAWMKAHPDYWHGMGPD